MTCSVTRVSVCPVKRGMARKRLLRPWYRLRAIGLSCTLTQDDTCPQSSVVVAAGRAHSQVTINTKLYLLHLGTGSDATSSQKLLHVLASPPRSSTPAPSPQELATASRCAGMLCKGRRRAVSSWKHGPAARAARASAVAAATTAGASHKACRCGLVQVPSAGTYARVLVGCCDVLAAMCC
jgi:hypothetical protein